LALILAASFATDKATAQQTAQQHDWSGFYGGIHAAGIWGGVTVTDSGRGVPPGPFSYTPGGAFGGGTGGYNVQMGPAVFGIETDIGYMGLNGSGTVPSSHPGQHQDITLDSGAYGDVTGRVGFAVGKTLFYGKGGFAFFTGEAKQTTTNPGYSSTGSSGAFTGWTVGGGAEYFVSPTVSVKAEYQHFDFGSKSAYQTALVDDPPTTAGTRFYNDNRLRADSIKLGMNFHF
jgi:outer membrane immunogenic protein